MASDYSSDADTWLNWAEATYAGAQTLFLSENALVWFSATILGQQSLEMFLKAALIRRGRKVLEDKTDIWGHDLCALARKLNAHQVTFHQGFMGELQRFTDYFNELRYPTNLKSVQELGQEEGLLLGTLVEVLRSLAVA